ncbi:glycosyltransferase [Streptomyces noursei]|uniref:glycosyltransferase n=1 Tax=Streptomyces noursei TaxID=1971 RepID=UPI0023DA198A|nr:glycosyltransferase [Streptomyces noursei]
MNTPQPQTFRLVVTGGGTGGHTYPALTATGALQERLSAGGGTLDVLWIGTADGLEARVAPAEGIAFATVATGKIRRSSNPLRMVSPANVRDMAQRARAHGRPDAADRLVDVILAAGRLTHSTGGARRCAGPCQLRSAPRRRGTRRRPARWGPDRPARGENGGVHRQDALGPLQHLQGDLLPRCAGRSYLRRRAALTMSAWAG